MDNKGPQTGKLVIQSNPQLTPPEARALEMHRKIADRLRADPDGVLEIAAQNLETQRAADLEGTSSPYFDAWELLLYAPVDALVGVMTSMDQIARDLRQASPFAGVLTEEERLDVILRTDGPRVAKNAGVSNDDLRDKLTGASARWNSDFRAN